jgi:hypothetical protein
MELLQKIKSCSNCGTFKAFRWSGSICFNCYRNEKGYNRNKTHKIANIRNNPRKIRFKQRYIPLSWYTRTGYCSECPNNIFNKTCKQTHMHHDKGYFAIFPWFGTVELCVSCHNKRKN